MKIFSIILIGMLISFAPLNSHCIGQEPPIMPEDLNTVGEDAQIANNPLIPEDLNTNPSEKHIPNQLDGKGDNGIFDPGSWGMQSQDEQKMLPQTDTISGSGQAEEPPMETIKGSGYRRREMKGADPRKMGSQRAIDQKKAWSTPHQGVPKSGGNIGNPPTQPQTPSGKDPKESKGGKKGGKTTKAPKTKKK